MHFIHTKADFNPYKAPVIDDGRESKGNEWKVNDEEVDDGSVCVLEMIGQ